MRISDWSSDVCSSDLAGVADLGIARREDGRRDRQRGALDHHCRVACHLRRVIYPVYTDDRRRRVLTAVAVGNRVGEAVLGVVSFSQTLELAIGVVAETAVGIEGQKRPGGQGDRKSTRLNSSH